MPRKIPDFMPDFSKPLPELSLEQQATELADRITDSCAVLRKAALISDDVPRGIVLGIHASVKELKSLVVKAFMSGEGVSYESPLQALDRAERIMFIHGTIIRDFT